VAAYNVDNIIPVTTTISPTGLGFANFAKAVGFAPEAELPVGFEVDTRRTYTSLPALSVDFADTTETYKMAQRWLGGIPATREIVIWGVDSTDATITATLNKARNAMWWYWTFFTKDVYADVADVALVAQWADDNESFFMDCQTTTLAAAIRDGNVDTDIASVLTASGYRRTGTFTHATDPYAGIALCKWLAAVNYSAANSTITAEYKKLSGVTAEELTDSEYAAMKDLTKKAMFYTVVELQGSEDAGRVINSYTHSSFGEFMDDVVNLDAFINGVKIAVYNAITSAKKLGQTSIGQAVINSAARTVGQQYVTNGYLGERNYLDPDDGVTKYTFGYEVLTDPLDILNISDSDRDARKSAVLKLRIFRAGAIHQAPVDIEVY
jgi:hypothetical protein